MIDTTSKLSVYSNIYEQYWIKMWHDTHTHISNYIFFCVHVSVTFYIFCTDTPL